MSSDCQFRCLRCLQVFHVTLALLLSLSLTVLLVFLCLPQYDHATLFYPLSTLLSQIYTAVSLLIALLTLLSAIKLHYVTFLLFPLLLLFDTCLATWLHFEHEKPFALLVAIACALLFLVALVFAELMRRNQRRTRSRQSTGSVLDENRNPREEKQLISAESFSGPKSEVPMKWIDED